MITVPLEKIFYEHFGENFGTATAITIYTTCINNWRLIDLLSAIGRTLVPRYFRSIFEGGVTDLYYILKHSKESFHNTSITLDCDQATMITHHGKPMFTKVRAQALSETHSQSYWCLHWPWVFCMEGTVALWHVNLIFPVELQICIYFDPIDNTEIFINLMRLDGQQITLQICLEISDIWYKEKFQIFYFSLSYKQLFV